MTATAVVGSAAEDTTPSEREAPQRFAWWHPRSADLGRHKARRSRCGRGGAGRDAGSCASPTCSEPRPAESSSPPSRGGGDMAAPRSPPAAGDSLVAAVTPQSKSARVGGDCRANRCLSGAGARPAASAAAGTAFTAVSKSSQMSFLCSPIGRPLSTKTARVRLSIALW